jgi:hypothetical protein
LDSSAFYFFGKVKSHFQRSNFGHDDELLSEVSELSQSIPVDELKRVFTPWKERCVWVDVNNGVNFPAEEMIVRNDLPNPIARERSR